MNNEPVNATMSFAAPVTADLLRHGVGPRPRTDVIARIKSNTKTHRGTPRPLDTQERITGDYDKPNETAVSQQRPLDLDTLQELAAADDTLGVWGAESHHTRSFNSPRIRSSSAPASRRAQAQTQTQPETPEASASQRIPLRRAPDTILRPTARTPAAENTRPDMRARPARPEPYGRWPITAIVVSTLLAALFGGLIAMAATGG